MSRNTESLIKKIAEAELIVIYLAQKGASKESIGSAIIEMNKYTHELLYQDRSILINENNPVLSKMVFLQKERQRKLLA